MTRSTPEPPTRVGGFPRMLIALGLALAVGALATLRFVQVRSVERRAQPVLDGRLQVPGPEEPLRVVRDARGIPHVRAGNSRDALFGLGFAHAQDRLAQMEWLRRSALGRTAEVIGSDGLPADRWARTLGIGVRAEAEAAALDVETRQALEAYAAGINARLERIRSGAAGAPPILLQLGVDLEPWTPAHTLAVLKAYAWSLDGSHDASLVLSDLIERLGGFGARPFFPPSASGDLVPLPPHSPIEARAPGLSPDPLRRAFGLVGRSVGSSAWLVAGRMSQQRRPLLASDLHLGPTAPSLMYEAHWSTPGVEVAGVTLPGAPVFWSGHNGRVAWAATHARCAVVDLYWETLDPDDSNRYRDGHRWRRVSRREETIAVRGGDSEVLEVRATDRGPLIHERLGGERAPLAVAWSGIESGGPAASGVAALLRAVRASGASSFRAALADHREPVLAFVFADRNGDGGLQMAGWVPSRALSTGRVPLPGRSGWYAWRGPLPFEALPRAELGSEPWLVAADNPLPAVADAEVPLEWWWRDGRRARRIEQLLRAATERGPLDARGVAALQRDVGIDAALDRVGMALELAGDLQDLPPETRQVAESLRNWGGEARADSVGAAVWHLLQLETVRAVLEQPFGPELLARYLDLRGVGPDVLLDAIFGIATATTPPPDAVTDSAAVVAALRASLRRTGLALRARLGVDADRWHWGRLHALRFRPFGWASASPSLSSRLRNGFPYAGNGVTVAAAEYDPGHPFDVRVVSGYRWVVDLASPEHALSALASAPSDQSPSADAAGFERWLAGELTLLATHPLAVDETARATLLLEPAP